LPVRLVVGVKETGRWSFLGEGIGPSRRGIGASAPTAEAAAARSSRSRRAMKLVSYYNKFTTSCAVDEATSLVV
jgi:hypothetical protein